MNKLLFEVWSRWFRLRAPRHVGLVGVALGGWVAASAVLAQPVGLSPALDTAPTHATVPGQWVAPLPTASRGSDAAALTAWWQRLNDPVLTRLMGWAQQASPDLASARTRLMQARAGSVAAGAALGPQVDAQLSAQRTRPDLVTPVLTSASGGLSASWALDLSGGQRAARDAAGARLDVAQAAWHEARVAVAVSTAGLYFNLRACEAQAALDQAEVWSREATARVVDQSSRAGMDASAQARMTEALAAQARATWAARILQCAQGRHALAALTAVPEATLRDALAPGQAQLPAPVGLAVPEVPAAVLAQRPDVFRAERLVQAATADVKVQDAEHLPRIALAGSLSALGVRTQGATTNGSVWSIGPLQITLPVFDGGRRAAQSDASRAAYDEATTAYAATLRQAVREVEEALLRIHTGQQRSAELQQALAGFDAAARAADARWQAGLANRLELEDARRQVLAMQAAELAQRKDTLDAWVALYTALGGGWTPDVQAQSLTQTQSRP